MLLPVFTGGGGVLKPDCGPLVNDSSVKLFHNENRNQINRTLTETKKEFHDDCKCEA